jgi:hypothetical protein
MELNKYDEFFAWFNLVKPHDALCALIGGAFLLLVRKSRKKR